MRVHHKIGTKDIKTNCISGPSVHIYIKQSSNDTYICRHLPSQICIISIQISKKSCQNTFYRFLGLSSKRKHVRYLPFLYIMSLHPAFPYWVLFITFQTINFESQEKEMLGNSQFESVLCQYGIQFATKAVLNSELLCPFTYHNFTFFCLSLTSWLLNPSTSTALQKSLIDFAKTHYKEITQICNIV